MLFVGSNPTPSTTKRDRRPLALAPGAASSILPLMAVRRYSVIRPDGSEGELLEVDQPLSAPDLTTHPLTGEPLRRMIENPTLSGRWTDRAMGAAAKDSTKLKAGGFRKLERDGDSWRDVT